MNEHIDIARLAFTAKEAAALIGVSYNTIRRATEEGLLPCRRLGRLVRYTREDLQVYLDSHREAGFISNM